MHPKLTRRILLDPLKAEAYLLHIYLLYRATTIRDYALIKIAEPRASLGGGRFLNFKNYLPALQVSHHSFRKTLIVTK